MPRLPGWALLGHRRKKLQNLDVSYAARQGAGGLKIEPSKELVLLLRFNGGAVNNGDAGQTAGSIAFISNDPRLPSLAVALAFEVIETTLMGIALPQSVAVGNLQPAQKVARSLRLLNLFPGAIAYAFANCNDTKWLRLRCRDKARCTIGQQRCSGSLKTAAEEKIGLSIVAPTEARTFTTSLTLLSQTVSNSNAKNATWTASVSFTVLPAACSAVTSYISAAPACANGTALATVAATAGIALRLFVCARDRYKNAYTAPDKTFTVSLTQTPGSGVQWSTTATFMYALSRNVLSIQLPRRGNWSGLVTLDGRTVQVLKITARAQTCNASLGRMASVTGASCVCRRGLILQAGNCRPCNAGWQADSSNTFCEACGKDKARGANDTVCATCNTRKTFKRCKLL